MSGLLPPLSSRTSTMSHPTCCCSVSLDRCDRCDLLVDLEGFHLMSAVRTPDALVLDVESCNQLAGCPDCGVIAQGHGRVVVEVIDALGRGPGADPGGISDAGYAANIPARSRLSLSRTTRCVLPGASGCSGDPLGDPTVALRGSHYLGAGPPVRNHVEYRVVP